MVAKPPSPSGRPRTIESGWILLPAEGRTDPAPKLSLAGRGLSKARQTRARELWRRWWSSPMACMWGDADVDQVERMLLLRMRVEVGGTAAELSECRQMEDRFGLSPAARRKLYWRIDGVDVPSKHVEDLVAEPEPESAPKRIPTAGGDNDPRRGLSVVEGGKAG